MLNKTIYLIGLYGFIGLFIVFVSVLIFILFRILFRRLPKHETKR